MSASLIRFQTLSVSEFHQQTLMNVCSGGSLVDTGNYCSFCGPHLQELEPCNHITPARTQSMHYKSMTAFSLHAPHLSPAHPCDVKINEFTEARAWGIDCVNGRFSPGVDVGLPVVANNQHELRSAPACASCCCLLWLRISRLSNVI